MELCIASIPSGSGVETKVDSAAVALIKVDSEAVALRWIVQLLH